ncbi:MAG: hypothetical protein ABUK01_15040 [Leptospirales bacterium]
MKKIFITLTLLLFSSSIFAVNWENHGFTVDKIVDKGEKKTATLNDSDSNQITVTYDTEPSEANAKIIKKLNTKLRSWGNMKVGELHFSIHNGTIEILVNPSEFTYKKVNYLEYLSAGIYFSFTDDLYYNFRIAVDRVFVVIKGTFTDEATFNDKVFAAIEDPRGYMKRRDPEYLLEQIESLEADQYRTKMALIATIRRKPMNPSKVNKIVKMKKENPSFTSTEIAEAFKEKEIKISTSDIKVVLSVFFNEFE